jgi:hypothetical protein
MKLHKVVVVLVILVVAAGCRSRVIRVQLINSSSQPVSTIIVDYPGATFGVNSLAPGRTFLYVIKPLETGPLKVQFTNARGVGHSYSGPTLHKNQEGTIEIKLTQDFASASAI